MNRFSALTILAVLTACHFRSSSAPEAAPAPVEPEPAPVAVQNQSLQRTIEAEGFSSKGTIEAVTEVPVYSRISEQIVAFDMKLGQRVKKGQVVARLSQAVLNDRIARNKAELEKAVEMGLYDKARENAEAIIRESLSQFGGYTVAFE